MNAFSLPLALALLAPLACGAPQDPTPVEPSLHLERAFPAQTFKKPLLLTAAGDGSPRLYVIEQDGRILTFDPAKAEEPATVVLDIREKISTAFNEEGLLGLAFHPGFKENRQFFVHYSSKDPDHVGVLARYRIDPENPLRALPDSEEILLTQPQPWRNHNGGMIAFGPDGFLYLSFGDGGSGGDPKGSGQDRTTLLGAILRIDVDHKTGDLPYAIPADNPFVDETSRAAGLRGEIYAYGLRNAWRFSFDRKTGDLWAGDVGQNRWEEIDLIVKGGNYGWNHFEAFVPFPDGREIQGSQPIDPIAAYGRTEGVSVTGGYVYRGSRFPELQGSYIFGDYATGHLWRTVSKDGGWRTTIALERCGQLISSFGEDAEGELYLLSHNGGGLFRVCAGKAD
ncbi:MAG: PQQ-dependent sugar dehydrogenase [Planctomycetota bacterium]